MPASVRRCWKASRCGSRTTNRCQIGSAHSGHVRKHQATIGTMLKILARHSRASGVPVVQVLELHAKHGGLQGILIAAPMRTGSML